MNENLTPKAIVAALDAHIIGQADAKRSHSENTHCVHVPAIRYRTCYTVTCLRDRFDLVSML